MNRGGTKNQSGNAFAAAIAKTDDVKGCYQPGLKAIEGKYRSKVNVSGSADGSVDIDTCTKTQYPSDSRWDYVIGYNGKAYFIEVYSAETSEVSKVLQKLQWLKQATDKGTSFTGNSGRTPLLLDSVGTIQHTAQFQTGQTGG